MAKIEMVVEINDDSLFAVLADVKEKQRELNAAIGALDRVITGRYAEIPSTAAVVKEIPRE